MHKRFCPFDLAQGKSFDCVLLHFAQDDPSSHRKVNPEQAPDFRGAPKPFGRILQDFDAISG